MGTEEYENTGVKLGKNKFKLNLREKNYFNEKVL